VPRGEAAAGSSGLLAPGLIRIRNVAGWRDGLSLQVSTHGLPLIPAYGHVLIYHMPRIKHVLIRYRCTGCERRLTRVLTQINAAVTH